MIVDLLPYVLIMHTAVANQLPAPALSKPIAKALSYEGAFRF